jgi:hypothetical protein
LKKPTFQIIEGIQIIELFTRDESFANLCSNCAIIIKGTSALSSTIRAYKRNTEGQKGINFEELKRLINLSLIINFNKNLEKMKKDIKGKKK